MMDRPEWVKCVLQPEDSVLTWCDRRVERPEFAFTSIDHAALNGRHGDQLVACEVCLSHIHRALYRGVTPY